jgi:hypothetical protein
VRLIARDRRRGDRRVETADGSRPLGAGRRSHHTYDDADDAPLHRHVSNIFAKIGVNSRTAAAAYAVQHGLLP